MYDYHTFMNAKRHNPLLPRAAADMVRQACRMSPVVIVLGARQTGKTTLVRTMPELANRHYVSLDDVEVRDLAQRDPARLLQQSEDWTIDEVQRAPDLLLGIKRAVDTTKPRRPGQFVLTGSANLLMMERVSESLAGRAVYVSLWPFTRRERAGLGSTGPWSALLSRPFGEWLETLQDNSGPREDWREAVRSGGLPVPAHELESDDERALWFSGYVQTFLERDLQDLRAVQDLADFRRLMRAACLRIGNLINQTELGRDMGMSQPQVHRYLNLLETSFQAVRIPAYSVNRTRRLIKTPKLYWSDPGLAMFLAGETEPRGAHLENLVLLDLLAWRDCQPRRPEVHYWRTASGLEIDFIVESGSRLMPIEVKSGGIDSGSTKAMEHFLDDHRDQADGGLLLYDGEKTLKLSDRVIAVPWWRVC